MLDHMYTYIVITLLPLELIFTSHSLGPPRSRDLVQMHHHFWFYSSWFSLDVTVTSGISWNQSMDHYSPSPPLWNCTGMHAWKEFHQDTNFWVCTNTPWDSSRLWTRPSALNSSPSQHNLSATFSMNQAVATSLKFDLLLQTLPRRCGVEIRSFLDPGELSWMKKLQRSNYLLKSCLQQLTSTTGPIHFSGTSKSMLLWSPSGLMRA